MKTHTATITLTRIVGSDGLNVSCAFDPPVQDTEDSNRCASAAMLMLGALKDAAEEDDQ